MFREIEQCTRRSVANLQTDCEDKHLSGIESYGISVTTLEEVFLKVAGCDFDEAECLGEQRETALPDYAVSQACDDYAPKKKNYSKICGNYMKIVGFIYITSHRACSLFVAAILSFVRFLSMQCCCSCMLTRSTFWKHSKALLIKRALSVRRDRKTIVFQLLIPAIFLFFGLLFLKLKPHPDQQSVTLTTSHFNPLLSGGGGGGPIPYDLSRPISQEVGSYS